MSGISLFIELTRQISNNNNNNAYFSGSCRSKVKQQKAKWIQTKNEFSYADSTTLQATLVELPYINNKNSNEKASMIIILPWPQHKCDVTGWMKRYMNWPSVVDAVKSMEVKNVQVTMPQFEIEAEFELSKVLSQMGMEPAFSNSANFNGMVDTGNANIRISKVLHKAKVNTRTGYITNIYFDAHV